MAVTGNLDADAEEEFRRFLTDATAPGKPVFIDLTAVTFIGGRGYRAVRRAARALPPGPGPVL